MGTSSPTAGSPGCSTVDSADPIAGRRIIFVVNVDWFFLSHRLPLALAASRAGADVWIASADSGQSDAIRRHGLRFVPLPIARHRGGILAELAAFTSMARLYARARPDLVHHVTIKPVLYGSMIARLLRIRTVNAISGFGHAFGASRTKLMGTVVDCAYRIALHHPRSVTIFQNEEDRDEFAGRDVVDRRKTVVIRGSGVDCEVFRPTRERPTTPVVMFASRMLREKGVEDFVRAARHLRADFPRVRFVLVGGPDDSPSSVTDLELRRWHDEGAVERWGRSDSMHEVLPKASIFVLPTFYREGVPKVLLEAAACGVPMVTTNVPGCRDVVHDGVTGLLVAPHDSVGLANAIRELLEDEELRVRMGARARALAESDFSVGGVVDRTLTLYRSLLSLS